MVNVYSITFTINVVYSATQWIYPTIANSMSNTCFTPSIQLITETHRVYVEKFFSYVSSSLTRSGIRCENSVLLSKLDQYTSMIVSIIGQE